MLSGCGAGVNKVEVSPSGQFVAGADYRGIVHIWDLRNGRKLNEFKHHTDSATHAKKSQPATYHTVHEFHSMRHSHCYVPAVMIQTFIFGMLKVWEMIRRILSLQQHLNKASDRPFKTFRTKRTSILDLQYTKRNLLLSVGKYF
jgi:WD40 repeat protein